MIRCFRKFEIIANHKSLISIQFDGSYVEERKNTNIRLSDLVKTMVFPIIAFVAGAIGR